MFNKSLLRQGQLRHAEYYLNYLQTSNDHFRESRQVNDDFSRNWAQIEFAQSWASSHPQDNDALRLTALFPKVGDRVLRQRLPAEILRGWYESGLQAARELGDDIGQTFHAQKLVYLCSMTGDFALAIEYAELARDIAKQRGDLKLQIEAIYLLAMATQHAGQFEKSLAAAKAGYQLVLQETSDNDRMRYFFVTVLGGAYNMLGRFSDAIKMFREALDIAEASNSAPYRSTQLSNLGTSYYELEEYEPAFEYFTAALDISVQQDDKASECYFRYNLACVQQRIGDAENALDNLYQAKQLDIEITGEGSIDLPAYLEVEAEIWAMMGNHEEALQCARRSLENARQRNDQHRIASGYVCLARRHEGQTAIDYAQQAIAIYDQHPHIRDRAHALEQLGRAYRQLGQQEQAKAVFAELKTLYEKMGNKVGIARLNTASLKKV